MKGWLRDRVADIACLSGRTDSGLSLRKRMAYPRGAKADIQMKRSKPPPRRGE